ncbi:anthranilate synthase component II [Oceanisphaera avium]|uniref:Anthranilate/aminodeoxychorismate synthase component II n=1 Tax=Oceanisphaera avium TaxID=1903694 RepID=A0A1Y0D065_9GAMM|nr:aminodeoxychorismate/anthranilate synthase component II [Oceanisphaera avium]ART80978.1 anthranilate/aminodeoxychorismate synthase component II [Oceanisphaera avium]
MLLMLDNYDSFTYNLVQYFAELGQEVMVRRNDEISVAEIAQLQPAGLVISPGPCTPNEAGISLAAIKEFAPQLPILGVCLGHQAIAQAFGGKVVRARQVMHGKTSAIAHCHQGLFKGLPCPLTVTRYHSLIVEAESLPECFSVTAWSQTDKGERDEIMAMQHKTLPIHSVQFHPESIMSECGHQLLANFLSLLAAPASALASL